MSRLFHALLLMSVMAVSCCHIYDTDGRMKSAIYHLFLALVSTFLIEMSARYGA